MSTKLKIPADKVDQRRKVLERLFRVWNEHPNMSLGRLIQSTTTGVHVEHLFDDELLGLMEQSISKRARRELSKEFPL